VGDDYCRGLAGEYTARRQKIVPKLQAAGFRCTWPEGAYYVITDVGDFLPEHGRDDDEFARWLVREVGVAAVPGSSFYHEPHLGSRQVRFCFSKRGATLDEAARRLAMLKQSGRNGCVRA
jgi:aminotransferase